VLLERHDEHREGVPLTTIAKEVGTSITMIEKHYAGVVENWDGKRVPADVQIRAARKKWTRRGTQRRERGTRGMKRFACKSAQARRRTRTGNPFITSGQFAGQLSFVACDSF
jgi:hypothetical protein